MREIESLSHERDPELYGEGLLSLAQRLAKQDRLEPALRLFHHLQQNNPAASAIARKAGREIDAIEGRGAIGGRVEFSIGRFSREAMNPALLFGMATAGTVFQVSRAALLGKLLGSAPSLATRGFGARALAGSAAFALEGPSFVAATQGARLALGENPAPHSSFGKELAGAYLTLGGLKLVGWGGEQAVRLSGAGALARATIPQASAYLGLLAGHGLEHWTGLRQISSGDTWLLDSLITMAQLKVGGGLSNALLGRRFANFQSGLNLAAEQSMPLPKLPSLEALSPGLAFDAPGIPRSQAWREALHGPFKIQGSGRKSPSGFWNAADSSNSSASLKSRMIPEGLPQMPLERSDNPVAAIAGLLENHMNRFHPQSLEIHYQGRMIVHRDQEVLKARLRPLFEKSAIPQGFVAVIAFLEGMPKIALIYKKVNDRMDSQFTTLRLPDNQSSSPNLGLAPGFGTSAIRTLSRVEDLHDQLAEILQTRSPKINYAGEWRIRDDMALAQMLQRPGGLAPDQTFTLALKERGVQIVFEWKTEKGVRKVESITQPIDSSFLSLNSAASSSGTTPRTPAVTPHEGRERISDPGRSTPLPAETSDARVHSCPSPNKALEKFHELLIGGDPLAFIPSIEMRSGNLDESSLAFIAEMLSSNPLPKGRKVNLVWVERPSGFLRIESDESGKVTAELRVFGQGSQNYLLKPNFAGGEKLEMRFVRHR
ncbi:MAG TPA: hypothetical protein VJR29_01470 [bacterium]|nr:hypothetical protein [bacterium]